MHWIPRAPSSRHRPKPVGPASYTTNRSSADARESSLFQLGYVVGDHPKVPSLAGGTALAYGDGDRVLVDVQTDELRYPCHWTGFLCGSAPRLVSQPPHRNPRTKE